MILEGLSTAVTGAGSGIGAATARRFARQGAMVACLGLSADVAQRTATKIGGPAYGLDVSDSAAVAEVDPVVTTLTMNRPTKATRCAFGRDRRGPYQATPRVIAW